ncbi:MAG: transposase [Solirubrobacteraceae bacterium]
MSLGLTPRQQDMFATTTSFCEPLVAPDSIYALLHRDCHRLFPDEMFADLFCDVGRRCVPPTIVAVVMVLQRLEGCSDREAVDRFRFDLRWKYAAGGLDFHFPGFVHTVLVDMRFRLAASEDPERIFNVVLDVGKRAGLVGRRRVLDSTPIYDAVATMDTVTLVRSAIRGLLAVCESALEAELRGLLRREDDYRSAGKPACDYDDRDAREALIDALAKDARALLAALDGRELEDEVAEAAAMLASVVGQDLDEGSDRVFRIARRVAKDRIISTVDPDARHGHKTAARGFDGYKGHVCVDPDSELITATTVTAGNAGDATAATELLADELASADQQPQPEPQPEQSEPEQPQPEQLDSSHVAAQAAAEQPQGERGDSCSAADQPPAEERSLAGCEASRTPSLSPGAEQGDTDRKLSVYGDAAYGSGEVIDTLEQADAEVNCKVQPPVAPGGRYSKDAFSIDLAAGTVTCPAGQITTLRSSGAGQIAYFGQACGGCPLAAQCTTAQGGRTVYVGPYEQQLARARQRQSDPAWKADYKATRPKVERKIAVLMRRKHGGRRARVRGKPKVQADFALLAAAVNLARLAVLGLTAQHGGWHTHTA